MIRLSRLYFWLLAALLLVWLLPWCVNYLTLRGEHAPFTLYSSVLGDFVRVGHDGKAPIYSDCKGNTYTREEFDALLPLFYARQLAADGRFPDTICGRAFTPREAQAGTFVFRSTPQTLNQPETGLWFLLESRSGRVDLEMPDDAFRLTRSGIEFIDMATNRVDAAKSRLFTETMLRKGCRFPVRCIAGNPTTRKEYDEGYVLLDADRRLFHLKMVQGRPYVRAVELPEGLVAEELFLNEFRDRRLLAFLIDSRHAMYVLTLPGYRVQPVEGVRFDPRSESMSLIGTLLDWTIGIESQQGMRYYAVSNEDFSLLGTLDDPAAERRFPGLTFTAPSDCYVTPRLR